MSEGDSSPSGTSSRRKRSLIWEHFLYDQERKRLICRLSGCTKSYAFDPENPRSTSGALRHLKTAHHIQPHPEDNETTDRASSILSESEFMEKWMGDAKQERMKRGIALYVAIDDAPFSCAERHGFKSMMRIIRPDVDGLPCRSTITSEVEALYDAAKTQLLQRIGTSDFPVALTMDGWTSKAHRKYLTITVHFIEDWQLKTFVLNTKRLFFKRDAGAQREILSDTVSEWRLKGRIVAVVSDNERTSCCAIEGALPELGNASHLIRCACHTLQLAVRSAMELCEVQKAIQAARDVAIVFHASTKWGDLLEDQARKAGLSHHRAILDVPTRWNSTLAMLRRLVSLRKALDACFVTDECLSTSEHHPRPLHYGDYVIMEELIGILRPFEEATKALEGDSYVTLSMVYPVFGALKRGVLRITETDSEFVQNVKSILTKDLMSHWQEKLDGSVPLLATFLDPRFRELPFLTEEENRGMQQQFCDEACRVVELSMRVMPDPEELSTMQPVTEELPSAYEPGRTSFQELLDIVMSAAPSQKRRRQKDSAAMGRRQGDCDAGGARLLG